MLNWLDEAAVPAVACVGIAAALLAVYLFVAAWIPMML